MVDVFTDDFVGLGGDSLLALRASRRLTRTLFFSGSRRLGDAPFTVASSPALPSPASSAESCVGDETAYAKRSDVGFNGGKIADRNLRQQQQQPQHQEEGAKAATESVAVPCAWSVGDAARLQALLGGDEGAISGALDPRRMLQRPRSAPPTALEYARKLLATLKQPPPPPLPSSSSCALSPLCFARDETDRDKEGKVTSAGEERADACVAGAAGPATEGRSNGGEANRDDPMTAKAFWKCVAAGEAPLVRALVMLGAFPALPVRTAARTTPGAEAGDEEANRSERRSHVGKRSPLHGQPL